MLIKNKIDADGGYGVIAKAGGAYIYDNGITGAVLFVGVSGVVDRSTLDAAEGKNAADYVLLNIGTCGAGLCVPGGYDLTIRNDASSTASVEWGVGVTMTDADGNPLDGTFEMTSKKTSAMHYSAAIENGATAAPFNVTEKVVGDGSEVFRIEGGGVSTAGWRTLLFATPGDYNPYGWEACSGGSCEDGEASFVEETILPVIIKSMLASPTPSAQPKGPGAPPVPLPQGTYFRVARHYGLILGNSFNATVSLVINGSYENTCDENMKLYVTRDGVPADKGKFLECKSGMHLFEVDTKIPGAYRLTARAVILGKEYDSWSETVTRFGNPPQATPEMTPLLALGAALFAFWALRKRK